jgi:hypothetical protein
LTVPPPPDFAPVKNAIKDLKSFSLDAFHSMAQGMGQTVVAWAAGAKGVGMSAKELAKSVLQSLAAMALTQAIIELAEAAAGLTHWGMLMYGPPGPHLHAAALFGIAAAGAGALSAAIGGGGSAASSAVASNAFSSPSNSSGSSSDNSPAPIVQGRPGGLGNPNVPQSSTITVHVVVHATHEPGTLVDATVAAVEKEGRLQHAITTAVQKMYNRSHPIRADLRSDMATA